jgi:glutamate-5-semialdehyde dehydrogenase
MLDRLRLDEAEFRSDRIEAMAAGIEQVATLPDPVGQVMDVGPPQRHPHRAGPRAHRHHRHHLRKPPERHRDAAALCFKTGNATILRGGSEAIHSNRAIAAALAGRRRSRARHPAGPLHRPRKRRRLAGMDQWLDLIIPRGGKGLIETVVSLARMPVIKHYDGICHLFVDKAADLDMAVSPHRQCQDPEMRRLQRLETLLVHRDIAATFLPAAAAALRAKRASNSAAATKPAPS